MDAALRDGTKAKIEARCLDIVEAIIAGHDPSQAAGLGPLCFSKLQPEAHDGAYQLASTLKVMRTSYELLSAGATATQRELYYMNAEFFGGQDMSGQAIKAAGKLLDVPKHRLGLFAASRGWYAGAVIDDEDAMATDSTLEGGYAGMAPRPVPADAVSDRVPVRVSADCEFILVVEKECIFRRLAEDRLWEQPGMRCVIVTGCGFPDLATRAFVSQLYNGSADVFGGQKLPVYGLCDWNVFGLGVLLSYTRASKAHPESAAWAVPLQWLGLHGRDIDDFELPSSSLQSTSAIDESRAVAMLRDPVVQSRPYLEEEVQSWIDGHEKMELEGIMGRGLAFLAHTYLPSKIEAAEYDAMPLGQEEW